MIFFLGKQIYVMRFQFEINWTSLDWGYPEKQLKSFPRSTWMFFNNLGSVILPVYTTDLCDDHPWLEIDHISNFGQEVSRK